MEKVSSLHIQNNETYNQVFQDIGIRLIPTLVNQKEDTLVSSIEVLKKYDADILFVMNDTQQLTQTFFPKSSFNYAQSSTK